MFALWMGYAATLLFEFAFSELCVLGFLFRVRASRIGMGDGVAERLLDAIEPDLATWSEKIGLPYIRPELSSEGKKLIIHSPARFMKVYLAELRRACRDGMNFVLL